MPDSRPTAIKSLRRVAVLAALGLAAATRAASVLPGVEEPLAPAAPTPAPPAVAAKEVWALGTRVDGGRTVIYRYIDDLGPRAGERADEPDRVTLTWRYDADAHNGLPADDEQAGMDALEDLLEPEVETVGFGNLALVRTGAGVREWTYYTRSGSEFLARLDAVLPAHPEFEGKVRVDVASDPGWTAYEAIRSSLAKKR